MARVLSPKSGLFREVESFDPAMIHGNRKLTRENIHVGRDKEDWHGYWGDVYRKI